MLCFLGKRIQIEIGIAIESVERVAWVYEKVRCLKGIHRPARDQWLRASQSIPLNIAEGNGKTAEADRRRYFEIARGSALECAAKMLI